MHLELSSTLKSQTIDQFLDVLKAKSQGITSLGLNCNGFGSRKATDLERLINELAFIFPELQSLDLAVNGLFRLSSDELTRVFEALARLPKLCKLNLAHNQLGCDNAFRALASSSSLQDLNLTGMNIQPSIIEALSASSTLISLDLREHPALSQPLFQALSRIPQLQALHLESTGLARYSTTELIDFFSALLPHSLRFLQLPYYVFTDSKGNIQRPLEELLPIVAAITSCGEDIRGSALKNLSDGELLVLFSSLPDKLKSFTPMLDWTEMRSIKEWCRTFKTLAEYPKLRPELCLRGLGSFNDEELSRLFDELASCLPYLKKLTLMSPMTIRDAPLSEQQIQTFVLPYLAKSEVSTCYLNIPGGRCEDLCRTELAEAKKAKQASFFAPSSDKSQVAPVIACSSSDDSQHFGLR